MTPPILLRSPKLRPAIINLFPRPKTAYRRLVGGGHYDFEIVDFRFSQHFVECGEVVYAVISVRNCGSLQGTVYTRLIIHNPYPSFPQNLFEKVTNISVDRVLLDSHAPALRDHTDVLRQTEIEPGHERTFAYAFQVPEKALQYESGNIFYTRIELWQPGFRYGSHRNPLFGPHLFRCVTYTKLTAARGKKASPRLASRPKVLMSYAWEGSENIAWISELTNELEKHGVECWLDRRHLSGGSVVHSIRTGILDADCIVIMCTREYVGRWQAREGGVGRERPLIEEQIASRPHAILPVMVRRASEPAVPIPPELDSLLLVGMNSEDWRGEAFGELMRHILLVAARRHQVTTVQGS